jgi:hypothetical protein
VLVVPLALLRVGKDLVRILDLVEGSFGLLFGKGRLEKGTGIGIGEGMGTGIGVEIGIGIGIEIWG